MKHGTEIAPHSDLRSQSHQLAVRWPAQAVAGPEARLVGLGERTSQFASVAILACTACCWVAAGGSSGMQRAWSLSLLGLLALAASCACGLVWLTGGRLKPASEGALLKARLGHYTLCEKIGEGGMGIIFRARGAEGSAAIKLLRPERSNPAERDQFEREIELTRRLSHPNLAAIHDQGQTPLGNPYYVMEYIDGVDLETLVEQSGPLEPTRVAHLLAQVCGALAHAHAAGVIHRDITPRNVMVCAGGSGTDHVKVLDFGLAEARDGRGKAPDRSPSTRDNAQRIAGTPLYLAPEAVTAPSTVDDRTDLYSVGALGYFLLTGVPPFSGNGVTEICAHHLFTVPVPPSKRIGSWVPPELESLILSCLDKAKDRRPAAAGSLRDALLKFADRELKRTKRLSGSLELSPAHALCA